MSAKKGQRYQLADDPIVDLDVDEVRLEDGTRLTEERAAAIAERAIAGEAAAAEKRPVGRPKISDSSSTLAFRVPDDLRAAAEDLARVEGIKPSELGRRALEEYVERHKAS